MGRGRTVRSCKKKRLNLLPTKRERARETGKIPPEREKKGEEYSYPVEVIFIKREKRKSKHKRKRALVKVLAYLYGVDSIKFSFDKKKEGSLAAGRSFNTKTALFLMERREWIPRRIKKEGEPAHFLLEEMETGVQGGFQLRPPEGVPPTERRQGNTLGSSESKKVTTRGVGPPLLGPRDPNLFTKRKGKT